MKNFMLFIAFISFIGAKDEKFSENTPVLIFNTEIFKNHQIGFKNLDNPYFVMFYAPWCPHCKRLIPTWEKLADSNKDKVVVGAVDCTENQELQDRFLIRGFPTLLLFTPGNRLYQYKGERNFEKFQEYLEGGYQSTESEEIPQKSSVIRDIKSQLSQTPVLIALGVLALFTLILVGVCVMDYKESKKLEQMQNELELRKQSLANPNKDTDEIKLQDQTYTDQKEKID